jgi:hypothetical protein
MPGQMNITKVNVDVSSNATTPPPLGVVSHVAATRSLLGNSIQKPEVEAVEAIRVDPVPYRY